jgi:hypothetical protein
MDVKLKIITCVKCNTVMGTSRKLERHLKRKIPCDRIIKCNTCSKVFKFTNDLKKHSARKTPCVLIHGNPTVAVGADTCIYCRKVFKNKYNVKEHHNICKIKNGGMEVLFTEVTRLVTKKFEQLRIEEQKSGNGNNTYIENQTNIQNQTNQINHFNTQLNINLINFGDGTDTIKSILQDRALEILSKKIQCDTPLVNQISDRVVNLIGLVFRNPDFKELQGVYVLDLEKEKDNAFYHEDGNWMLTDWSMLRKELLQKLYNCLARTKEDRQRDILNIINYIFVLGECGNCHTIKKLDENETLKIYNDMGRHLEFKTIANIETIKDIGAIS